MIRSQQSSHSLRNALSALVLFAPLLVARAGLAQEACGDTSCPKGFSCEVEPTACPAIDCVEGPCQPCVPNTVSVCRPGPCSADSDCADGMACADVEQTNCVATDTSGGAPCVEGACPEKPADASCSTTTSKQCLPRWALPCAADADCGAGFTCQEQEQCTCSGSTGTATPGTASTPPSSGSGSAGSAGSDSAAPTPSGTPPDRVPESCTCEPAGTKACVATQVACAADSDCPSAWSCRDNPSGACWADSNGNTGCTTADPAKLCFPPFSDLVSGGGNGAVATDGSGLPTTPKGDPGSGTPEVDQVAGSADGGCSIGNGRSGTQGELLALGLALGAALGLRRRRAQH